MLLVKQKPAALRGVGVDLVSRNRVKHFLSRHRDYVRERFLNPSERRSFKRLSLLEFAELFTAKEAFFKACGEAWMGLEGFQAMKMKRCEGDHFEMEWRPGHTRKLYRGEGHFFQSGDLVGAQAMIWRWSSTAFRPRALHTPATSRRRSIHAKMRRDYPLSSSLALRRASSAKAG